MNSLRGKKIAAKAGPNTISKPNLDAPTQRKVRCKCAICGKVDEFLLPKKGFHALSRGKNHEDAFPGIEQARLRQLQEQVCLKCQEAR